MLPKNVEDAYPLSPMQRLMLLHAISSAGTDVLLNQVCYEIRGLLDVTAFHRAWDTLVARHPALRTAFLWEGLPQPLQVVRTTVTLPFRQVDLTHLAEGEQLNAIDQVRRDNTSSSFVLGKAPLMRCTLVKLAPERHYFVWAVHHLVVDRWSHAVMFTDLRTMYAAYAAGAAPELGRPVPYRGYVDWIARQDRMAAERFWRAELVGVRESTLLATTGGTTARTRRLTTGRVVSVEKTRAVRDRATRWRTTPASLLLSAIGLVIANRTGHDDVLCGITVSGRPTDLPDAETIVGSFVNNLPARLTVRRDQAVADWVRDGQRAQARCQTHAYVSLTDIQAWSDVPPARPLFDTLVLLNLTDESDVLWPGIELTADNATLDAAYPLLLSITVESDRFAFTLVHDSTFDAAGQLLADLEAMVARLSSIDDATRVGDLLASGTPARATEAQDRPARTNGTRPSTTEAFAEALLHAWRDVLGIENLGLDDEFFTLGGTSLQAAQLFARVERITGKTLPLSTLFGAGSVRALLTAIDRPVPRTGTLVGMRSSGTQAPLYAVPGIGGNVVGLSGLARALGPDQPFFAFESPGLDGREPPLASIDAIAERYARDIAHADQRPVHLLGLCWGAAVVAEVARKLTALGRAPLSLTFIDPTALLRETTPRQGSDEAGFLRSRLELYWDEFREGDWSDRTRLLANKARRAAKLLAGGDERRQSQLELNHFRVSEANKDAVVRYHPTRLEARARIFVTAYRGPGDDPRLEWLSLIEPTPDVIPVSGVNAGDAIAPANVGEFAELLRTWLRGVSNDATKPLVMGTQ